MVTPVETNGLPRLSQEALRMGPSAIREILKFSQESDIISFAGGLPEIETLPTYLIPELHEKAIKDFGEAIFNYGITEGFQPFRDINKYYLKGLGVSINDDINQVLIHNGAQQTIDIAGRILIDPGDYVIVERPTYVGAIQAFGPRQPRYLQVETDDYGLIPESLKEILLNYKARLLYLIPNFQNPSGKTIPWDRRKQIAELAEKYNIYVLEDDPYEELRYEGEHIDPIQSLIPKRTIYAHTYSKILSPGFRLAAAVVPNHMVDKMVEAKQGSDLNVGDYVQALATIYVRDGYLADHIPQIRAVYQPRRDAMLEEMNKYFSSEWHWSHSEGGMFIWVVGPDGVDTLDILKLAIKRKVVFVPGQGFFIDGRTNAIRLNFTSSEEEEIREEIPRVWESITENALIYQ